MTKSILACDPSITAFGWVVISQTGQVMHRGCIQTKPSPKVNKIRKGDDRCRRITEINTILLKLIRKYNIQYIVAEQPHGSQSAVAAIMIGVMLGMLQTLADTLDIGIEWYSEGESKQNILGKKTAVKVEMINAIRKEYPEFPFKNVKYFDEAVADAMAVFHCAHTFSPVLKYLLNREL